MKKAPISLAQLPLFLLLFIIGFLLAYLLFHNPKDKAKTEANLPPPVPALLNPFLNEYQRLGLSNVELKNFRDKIDAYVGKKEREIPGLHVSYYFRDLNQGLWIGIHEHEKFAPASLMKIPVMMAVLKKAEREPKILTLNMVYDSTKMSKVFEESGAIKRHGQTYTIVQLIEMMIEHSDNFSTLALLDYIGEEAVQAVEHDLNIYIREGYSEQTNFVTVKAYAGFFRILYNSSYLNREMSEMALQFLSKSIYPKGIRKAIPMGIKVAHKYGKRDINMDGHLNSIQLHHFALVYHPKKPFILGLMTRGSSLKMKEEILYDLSKITYDELEKQLAIPNSHMVFAE